MKHITSVPAAELSAMIPFAAKKGEVRHYLCGVLVTADALVSTDGHRMAIINGSTVPEGNEPADDYILPIAAVSNLCKKLGVRGRRDAQVNIHRDSDDNLHMIAVWEDDVREVTPELGGQFPDWKRVIPEWHNRQPHLSDGAEADRCFNWHYMADFQKVFDDLTREPKGQASVLLRLSDAGVPSSTVTCKAFDRFLGVIMPKRVN